MPFVSKAQLRTCYGKKRSKKEWDCDEWLDKTKSVCALPEKKGLPVKKRNAKVGERVVGKIQTGPRGGKYFLITEKNTRGKEICVVKVYV